MREKIIIIGAGGHARSVIDIVKENDEFELEGCIDNMYPNLKSINGMPEIPVIGNDNNIEEFFKRGIKHFFVAIGDNSLRNKLFDKMINMGYEPVNIISNTARISKKSYIGNGVCIMHGAVINVNSKIEDNVIINTNSSIDHDCLIEKGVHIAPGASISGYVNIGEGTLIGTGTSIIDKISIGKWSVIGGGSVVVNDIESNVVAYGVPARIVNKEK